MQEQSTASGRGGVKQPVIQSMLGGPGFYLRVSLIRLYFLLGAAFASTSSKRATIIYLSR